MKIFLICFVFLILNLFLTGFSVINNNIENEINFQNDKINLTGENKLSREISGRNAHSDFKTINLFDFEKNITGNNYESDIVSKASKLKLRKEILREVLKNSDDNILFKIPASENSFIELELIQSFPVSAGFSIFSKNGKKDVHYLNGLHYKGIIKGKENSIVSVSIFKNHVMGIISDEKGNYVLGSLKNSDDTYSDNYIFYNDADLIIKNKFRCRVDDYAENINQYRDGNKNSKTESSDNPTRLPVKIYFEADYQMYLDAGSNLQNVGDFIIGFFNSVKTIYQNEGIPVEISRIGVWDIPDPYINLNNSQDILNAFGEINQDNFEGNLAHLISTRTDTLGGIAWIRVLCGEYNPDDYSGRFAFSNINPYYEIYPAYSWTVDVVAHEMGHNFGSKHTHACVWPVGGTIGAIDSCYYAEGGCFANPRGTVGTIMSYCHLWEQQGGGVNFSLGFGPLPGDTIRLRYAQASCLDGYLNSSEAPYTFDLLQNFPNPFNPSTVISYELPVSNFVSLKVYNILGKEVSSLVNQNQNAGRFKVKFNAGNLSSGVYFYRIEAGDFAVTKRMLLLK